MNDLISRAYVLAEYDRQHQGPPGGARKIMEEAPTVDAIPIKWLKGLMLSTDDDVDKVEFAWIMREWQKEQEAR